MQVFRAVASVLVVMYHSKVSYNSYVRSLGSSDLVVGKGFIDYLGSSGVDFFFVISGFVITITFFRRMLFSADSLRDFIVKRLIRIAPPLWIAMVFHFVCILLFVGNYSFSWQNILASSVFLPSYNAYSQAQPFLVVSWTLNLEIFFYFSLAFSMLIFRAYALVFLAVLFSILSALWYAWGELNIMQQVYLNPIILEFSFGTFVGWLYLKNYLVRPGVGWILLGSSVLAVMTISYFGFRGDGYLGRALSYGLIYSVILYGALSVNKDTSPKGIIFAIGDASYSLYLTHIQTLIVAKSCFLFFYEKYGVILLYEYALAIMVLISLTVGLLFHRKIERPVTREINKLWGRMHELKKGALQNADLLAKRSHEAGDLRWLRLRR
ncbi:acyltransferase [Pseudomonas sp. RL]|uniref:acyltransferase family protein n=1 Tax=Pseudomonas sp. RL TaxID=1452718 RepID=UPI0009DE6890|nr:acyltransferase [Pseudomonas sp. RL]